MNRLIHMACLIALPLALTACGEKEPETKAVAAGEILEGSINDAMLPMDTVRSQPPLAPQTQAAAKAGKSEDAAEAGAGDEAATAADGGPAPVVALPAATPAPAPATTPAKAQ